MSEPRNVRDVVILLGGLSDRVGKLETTVMEITETIARNGPRLDAVVSTVKTVEQNTAEILAVMTYAKTWSGHARKYAPRVATLILGLAVGRGWITAENGANFMQIFGI